MSAQLLQIYTLSISLSPSRGVTSVRSKYIIQSNTPKQQKHAKMPCPRSLCGHTAGKKTVAVPNINQVLKVQYANIFK